MTNKNVQTSKQAINQQKTQISHPRPGPHSNATKKTKTRQQSQSTKRKQIKQKQKYDQTVHRRNCGSMQPQTRKQRFERAQGISEGSALILRRMPFQTQDYLLKFWTKMPMAGTMLGLQRRDHLQHQPMVFSMFSNGAQMFATA